MNATAKTLTLLALPTALTALGGCASTGQTSYVERDYRGYDTVAMRQPAYVYADGPYSSDVVVVQEAPPPAQCVTIVREAPPPLIVERRPAPPANSFVWVNGYWANQRGQWVWVRGRWAQPPQGHKTWVAPHWEPHGNEYHFSVGVWK